MSVASCLYEGVVRHRRMQPRRQFRHRIALAYLDLQEIPDLLDGRLLKRSPGLVRFRREDYLGDPRIALDDAVRELVRERIGVRPSGDVRLLTSLRTLGHCFNPVSFYYCLERDAANVEALVAEVTNTPWGERHAYVVRGGADEVDKRMHVSPFLAMDHVYAIRASVPGRALSIRIENRRQDAVVFDATLSLRRHELTRASLRATIRRYPAPALRTLALIYGHALRLRMAGARPLPHPGRA